MGNVMEHVSFDTEKWRPAESIDNILIIDDEDDWVSECEFMLSSLGYNCITAACGDEALRQVADGSVSTVIVDYNLPGGDGLSLIQELTDRARTRHGEIEALLAPLGYRLWRSGPDGFEAVSNLKPESGYRDYVFSARDDMAAILRSI